MIYNVNMLNKKQGRPSKLTPTRVRILSECFQNAMTTNIACDYANISRDTFYSWFEKDEDFRTQMNYAKAMAAQRLLKKVEEKEPWKLLKNVYRGEYIDDPLIQINMERPLASVPSQKLLEILGILETELESSENENTK